jgi:hypothetical protein
LLADQIEQQVERAIILFQMKVQRGCHFHIEYQQGELIQWTPCNKFAA